MRNWLMWIGGCCINTNLCRSAWDIWYTKRDGCDCTSSNVISMAVHGAPVSILLPQHYQVITVGMHARTPWQWGKISLYKWWLWLWYTSKQQQSLSRGKQRQRNRHTHNVHSQHPFIPINTANRLVHSVEIPESKWVQPRCIETGVSNWVLLKRAEEVCMESCLARWGVDTKGLCDGRSSELHINELEEFFSNFHAHLGCQRWTIKALSRRNWRAIALHADLKGAPECCDNQLGIAW